MNGNKLVSVIIPVYNAEKYIGELLESLQNQSYSKFEVICVDDGSSDESHQIIENFIKKDNRIKYVYQENKGVSAARNYGIRISKGDYLCFLDADDFVSNDYLSCMLSVMQERDADIVSCGYYLYQSAEKRIPYLNSKNVSLDSISALKAILENKILGMSACNKMFKRGILPADGFPEGYRINEDRYFVFCAVTQARRIAVIPDCLYNYRMNQDSASHQKFGEKYLDAVILSEKMHDWISMNVPELIPVAYACVYSSVFGVLYMIYERKAGREFQSIKKDIVNRISKADFSMLKGHVGKLGYYQMLCAKYCEPLLHLANIIKIAVEKRGKRR